MADEPLVRQIRMLRVLEITVLEGKGVEGNPFHLIEYYIDSETGKLIARKDPVAPAGVPREEAG